MGMSPHGEIAIPMAANTAPATGLVNREPGALDMTILREVLGRNVTATQVEADLLRQYYARSGSGDNPKSLAPAFPA